MEAVACDPSGSKLALVKAGKSGHWIVLDKAASPSDRYAAQELQTHVKACTRVELPIADGIPPDSIPMVVLGFGEMATRLGIEAREEQLGGQGFLFRTMAPHIVVAGTPDGGTLYGVRDFLYRELGIRWLTPGVTTIPAVTDVTVSTQCRRGKPAFKWRHTDFSSWPGSDMEFLSRRGMNSIGRVPDPRFGTQYAHDEIAHTYFSFIAPDDYYDDHPEYFSEVGGRRIRHGAQLCLTNPEVLEIVTEGMLKRMAEMPGCRQHNFSQMDYSNYCQCPQCAAVNRQYETSGGTQLWFVSRLAERTAKIYPDKLISTLAYTYTERPPEGLSLHPNVAVWLCHMYPCCDSHSVTLCEHNAAYMRHAIGWAQICPHLYIWHYVSNFAHSYCPFPNLRALAQDIKFYRDIGVEGIYAEAGGRHKEGGEFNSDGVYIKSTGEADPGGEFRLLRAYYVTELLSDPDQDPETILNDFLKGYYGAAAHPLAEYIRNLHVKVEEAGIHMHLYTNPAQGYLTDELLSASETLFDQAEQAVTDDEELLERVRVARMPLVYARAFPRQGYEFRDGRLLFPGKHVKSDEAQRFVDRMKKHGFHALREWGGDPEQLPLFVEVVNSGLDVVTIANGLITVDIVPILGARALRVNHDATGDCVTAYNVTRNLLFPFGGGEATYLGGMAAGVATMAGAMDPAVVVAQTPLSVTMEQLAGGFRLERIILLEPAQPEVVITAMLTNPSDRAASVQLRSHLDLDMGKLESTRVRFVSRSGKNVSEDMTEIVAGQREGKRYYSQECPKGAWVFSGSKGLQVAQQFDDDAVDFVWLYAYPADLQDLELDLWCHPNVLKPGESMTFSHRLRVSHAGNGEA